MTSPVIQFKRGAFANLPGLQAGEPALTTDTFEFYVGIDSTTNGNKFFGSHRYWKREGSSTGSGVNLVEGTSNGSDFITLKSPDSLSGITTYTFPATPTADFYLKTAADGTLSWATVPGATGTFSGINTFTNTTDNTLGNANTGAVQIDGGLGVEKNLTVGGNLNVQGYSEFVGVVTFKGGTINLGDANTDDINIAGEFVSNLVPNTNNTYDIGTNSQKWRDSYFAGIGSYANLRILNFLYDASNSSGTNGQFLVATGTGIGWTTIAGVAAGTISTATRANTVDTVTASDLNATHYLTFVNSHNGSATAETVYTDDGIYYNPGLNKLTTQHVDLTGNINVSGITTLAGNVILGDAAGDTITVNGTATFGQSITGTISTATKATLVDTTTAPSGTFYPGLFVSNTGTASTAVYVDSGISYVSNTDTLTLTGDVAINGGDATTTATTFNLINGTATSVNFAGAATSIVMGATTGIATINNPTVVGSQATQNLYNTVATNLNFGGDATALLVGATSGIATIRNTTFSLPNATAVNVNGANPTFSGTSTGTLTFFNTNLTGVNAFGAATNLVMGATTGIATINNPTVVGTQATQNLYNTVATNLNFGGAATALVMGAATGITTVRNKLVVAGNLEVDGNNIQASDGNTNITLTSNTLTTFAGDIKVNGNDIQASDGNTNITLTSNTLTTFSGDIRVNGNDIQSSTGANVITLSANNATFANDVTISGNLYINGSTTQVNTTSLTVEDSLIEVGLVNGSAPAADLNIDLGVLFNYYTTSAKKAGVYWDDSVSRIAVASDVTESSSVLTAAAYAALEIGSLWVTDCAGTSQVISCTGSTRKLENITIDGGTF